MYVLRFPGVKHGGLYQKRTIYMIFSIEVEDTVTNFIYLVTKKNSLTEVTEQ